MNKESDFYPSKSSVVVIGGGLAGLTAAYRLQQAGHQVDLYEARDRPGGRVYTISMGNSYAELGGQFLEDGGEAKTIRGLIQEFNLSEEMAWHDRKFRHFTLFNHHIEDASQLMLKVPQADEKLWDYLLSLSKQSNSLGEVLDQLFKGQEDHKLRLYFERRMTGYEGLDTKHLSVFYISSLFNFIKVVQERALAHLRGEEVSPFLLTHVKGGNSKLVEALANKLQGDIHYSSILTKIRRHHDFIQLHFKNGKIIETECLILALPCSTLRDVEIEEGLFPLDQMEAIHTLQYGTNAKLLVPVHLAAPPDIEFLITEHFGSWFNHDYSIITLYYGGLAGIFSTNKPEEAMQKMKEELPYLQLAYPSAHFSKEFPPVGMSWFNEEFSKGSYCTLGIHQEKIFQNYIEIAGEKMKVVFRPIQNQIFFAGEHTSIDYPATLEGAVESGEKAARLVISIEKETSLDL